MDCLEDRDVYVELGDDPGEDLSAALDALVQDSKTCGFSEAGCKRLSVTLELHRSVFDFGLENPHQPTCNQ